MMEVEKEGNIKTYFTSCEDCAGIGKKTRKISKKARLQYQISLEKYSTSTSNQIVPTPPIGQKYSCKTCNGTGILTSVNEIQPDTENLPHVAIIGGGIGGTALAVACLHRKIPFTLFERDNTVNDRSQGYGLTLQQASKTIEAFGINNLKDAIISSKHIVHTTDGKIIGEWGLRKWLPNNVKSNTSSEENSKRKNIHIPRQSLRMQLLNQLTDSNSVKWGHQLTNINELDNNEINLTFQVNGELKKFKTNLLVGADGIRSSVRKQVINEQDYPLRYLGCIVILGICSLENLQNLESDLLDSETVFQTANGNERIYMMPFTKNSIMWQLSFPMTEEDAKELSSKGTKALKEEAAKKTQWHSPIPQIIAATNETEISGYPVYDRQTLQTEQLKNAKNITLIGDAAHPMSPFKGQGANQALLDAISLARKIHIGCKNSTSWKTKGLRDSILSNYETEMVHRSATKVKDSAAAAEYLHSEIVLNVGNETRGSRNKKNSL